MTDDAVAFDDDDGLELVDGCFDVLKLGGRFTRRVRAISMLDCGHAVNSG